MRGFAVLKKHIPALGGGAVADLIAAFVKDMPGGNIAGALTGGFIDELLDRRAERARKIFIEEIAKAKRPIKDVHEQDELVAIVYRYLDAARQGAARLNLRLMAKTIRGQQESGELNADQFLRYAELLSTLARDEVIFLATLHRHYEKRDVPDTTQVYRNVVNELTGGDHLKDVDVKATATALQRTGLLLPIHTSIIGGAGYHCAPSPHLSRIAELASFEEALSETPEA